MIIECQERERVRGKLGEPENDGKYEGKTWDKVEHRCRKRSRAVLNTSIPKYLRQETVKK